MTNLDNYINLSTTNAEPICLRGQKLQIQGQGSGFKRIARQLQLNFTVCKMQPFFYQCHSTHKCEVSYLTKHSISSTNLIYRLAQCVRTLKEALAYDSTQLTVVKDPNTLRYYFRSYSDQTIRYVDLNKFNLNASSIKSFLIQGDQVNIDISKQLK